MEAKDLCLSSELERDKEQLMEDISRFIDTIRQTEDRILTIENRLNEAQWYLGEEKATRCRLEKELQSAADRIRELETQRVDLEAECQRLRKDLQDTQWYLGEERARHPNDTHT